MRKFFEKNNKNVRIYLLIRVLCYGMGEILTN